MGLLMLVTSHQVQGQVSPPRFGIGFSALISTDDILGFGMRGRVSAPVSRDLSFALDLGLAGFVLTGRTESSWVFMPQASGIVTLDAQNNRAPYIIGGVGGYIPITDANRNKGGPMLHGGMGWVRRLNETSIYYEINPGLVIERNEVELVIPLRVGVIF